MTAAATRTPVPSSTGPASGRNRGRSRSPAGLALVAVVAVVLVLVLRAHVAEPVRIASDSMTPTLRRGDVVLVDRRGVGMDDLARGDVVTFRSPLDGEEALKRVVGLPGDSVVILDALLYVNDRVVDEPYVDFAHWDGTFSERVEVPQGAVFLLGDNRLESIDSRDHGPVPVTDVGGRVLVRLWPPVRTGDSPPQPPPAQPPQPPQG